MIGSLVEGRPSWSSSHSWLLILCLNRGSVSVGPFNAKRKPCEAYRNFLPQPRPAGLGSLQVQAGTVLAEGEDRYAAKYDYNDRAGFEAKPRAETWAVDARTQTAAGTRGLAREPAAVAAPAGPATGRPSVAGAASQESPIYVATGIYSLPVTLPEGEVRLDFARPSGEAELSILAVPLSTIRGFYRTLAVFVGLLVVVGLAKLWRTPDKKRPISAVAIVAYVLLFVALSVLLGLLGLLISIFLILLSEARRGAFIRCPAA